MTDEMYIQKYLKYKNKYIALKNRYQQTGGSAATVASVVACPGVVNAQPSVIVPGKKQRGGSIPTVASVGSCPGIVNVQPTVIMPTKNQQGGNDTENLNNTEDIRTLFEQLGGKKKKKYTSQTESLFDSSSDILLFSSDSLSLSDSVSDSDFDKNL